MNLGIDLGTTFSVAARLDEDGNPDVIRNSEGDDKTPSVVQIRDDETVVGEPAVNEQMMYPDQTIERVKRHMGDEDWSVTVDGEEYTPEGISARILHKIRTDVEQETGEEIEDVAITVPADFGNREREATQNAAIAAGFNEDNGFDPEEDISLLAEPIAACLRYGVDEAGGETVFVYDLGGGTFDATIVQVSDDGGFEVDGTEGGQRLGGEDFDDELYEFIKGELLDQGHPDPDENDALRVDIYKQVREMKHTLSRADEGTTTVNLGSEVFQYEMTRDEFEDLTDHLVEQTFNKVDTLFDHDNVDANKDDIDRVLLVGGSTRIPRVQERVEEYFGMDPSKNLEQDFVVAEGAALFTEYDGGGGDPGPTSVLPRTIGVTVEDQDSGELVMSDIMEKNTEIPQAVSRNGYRKVDEAGTEIEIEILEGEKTLRDENDPLGTFRLENLERGKDPEFEIAFEVDSDGRLHAEAENLDTGQAADTTLELVDMVDVTGITEDVEEEMETNLQQDDEDEDEDEDQDD